MSDDRMTTGLRLPKGSSVLMAALETRLPRRIKRVPHPVVALSEPTDDGLARNFIAAYGDRCARRKVCHYNAGDEDDFDRLIVNLKRGLTTGNDASRAFPRLTTCLTALSTVGSDQNTEQRKLLDALYKNVIDRRPIFAFPASVGDLLPAWLANPVKLILQEPLLRWSYGVWLRRTRSLGWVPALTGDDRNFLTYLCSRSPDQIARYRRRILVEALLRDLQRQLRPSIYSVSFLRRHRAIVLLPQAGPGGAQWTFVKEYLEALGPRERGRRPIRRTPLQIVAACGDGPLPDETECRSIEPGPNTLEKAAELLEPSFAARTEENRATLLCVPVPGEEPDERAAEWYRDTASQYRRDRWNDHLVPITAVLLTGTVIAAGTWLVLDGLDHARAGACRETWKPPGSEEVVGLTDGNCLLSKRPDLRSVERTIAAQNEQVRKIHRQGPTNHPYRTVVFFAPLTVPSWGRTGANSLDELRGVALAQEAAFRSAQHDPTVVPIVVLIANSGDRFAWGPQVADRIVRHAKSDHTLAAVIGISQSRTESHEAIRRLSTVQIPIVGSTTTSDQILDSSPLYYQISPRNRREAETLAQFLRYQPVMAEPHGESVLVRKAVVVEDPRDEYSQNLAEDFRTAFGRDRIVRTYTFGPPEEGPPVHDPKGIDDIPEGTAGQLVHDVCTAIGQSPTLVFYTSRAQQLTGILDKVSAESACEGRQLAIVGSDEETRFISDGTIDVSAYPAVHFYNAAFSDLAYERTGVAQEFADRYRARYGDPADDSGAADAYDAFSAASMAINAAYHQNPDFPPEVVATNMNLGVVNLNGVTGLISFAGAHDVTRVPVDKPVFVVYETPRGPQTLLACGRYAAGAHGEWTTWGTGHQAFPCPHDNGR